MAAVGVLALQGNFARHAEAFDDLGQPVVEVRHVRQLDALKRQGIEEVAIGLIPGSEGARRLYERRGFRPRWLELVRRPGGG